MASVNKESIISADAVGLKPNSVVALRQSRSQISFKKARPCHCSEGINRIDELESVRRTMIFTISSHVRKMLPRLYVWPDAAGKDAACIKAFSKSAMVTKAPPAPRTNSMG